MITWGVGVRPSLVVLPPPMLHQAMFALKPLGTLHTVELA